MGNTSSDIDKEECAKLAKLVMEMEDSIKASLQKINKRIDELNSRLEKLEKAELLSKTPRVITDDIT
jgi:hypothetical protein